MAGRGNRIRLATAGCSSLTHRPAGFTMVELIVVMILAGILAAIGAARFFSRGIFEGPGFANQAAASLRFAQKQAIAQNRAQVFVRFDGASISLCYTNAFPCPSTPVDVQVRAPFSVTTDSTYCTSAKWYCLVKPASVSYTISLGAVSPTAPRSIYFDAVGRPYDASNNKALAAPMTLTATSGTDSTVVTLEPETGYVH